MSEDRVTIEINGTPYQARKGAMVIEVADEQGILVPRFCYHKKLSVVANCRMCLVEIERAPKPLPACATPVADGMKVYTRSPLAVGAQKAVMEFLLINHPLDCPICDQGGECELQDLSLGYGYGVSRFTERKRSVHDEDLGPLIETEMTRCIHCTRCIRVGEEIAGMPELGATDRGEWMRIGTFVERTVDSELSGNMIDVCPVGALTSKPFRFRARAWEMAERPAVAPHDAVGSNLHVHVLRNRLLRVVPRENEAVNEVWISDRDRFSYEGLYSEDRLQAPLIKRDGEWQEVDWEAALEHAAAGLERVRERAGAGRIGALASPSATLEEHYLLARLMRGLGSHNVDHRLREQDFRDQTEAPLAPWLGQPLASLERSQATLLVGADPRLEQPMANHRLRKSVLAGGRVMAVNPIDYAFNYPVAERLIVPPAEMVGTLAGIARALGGDDPPAPLAGLLGGARVEAEHRSMAEALLDTERATVLLGASAHAHPDASVLRALAGHIAGHSGARFGVLGEGANAAGAWLAGAVPHREAAGKPVADPGLTARAMIDEGLEGLVLLGIEPELDCYSSAAALAALERAGFVIAFTAFRTPDLERSADVLLPIALFAEQTGTFVNAEGRWQSFAEAVRPVGEARPAWRLLRVLGNRLGLAGFEYMEAGEITEELRRLVGVDLAADSARWALPERLEPGPRGGLERIGDVPPYAVDALVRRAGALQRTALAVDAAAGVAPALAARIGLEPGGRARVRQGAAEVTLEVVIDERVPDGCVRVHAAVPGSRGLGPAFGAIEVESA